MISQIDKEIIRSWSGYVVEPRLTRLLGRPKRGGGPRIAVVGNCQSYGVAYGMKLLEPESTVERFSMIGRSRASLELLAKTLDTYDYVFSHEFIAGHMRSGGGSEELIRLLPKTKLFPAISFAAFHPDLVFIHDHSRLHGFIGSPLGPYHSALALFAYRKGLSLDMANALFNENVFEAIGYLDMWSAAAHELIETTKSKYQLDLSAELMSWSRRGVFMYSTLHPMGFVLFDIGRKLLEAAGRKPRAMNFPYYDIHELARSEIFPVYPPIANRYGARGEYLFKRENQHMSQGVGEFLTLPRFLAASYGVYARHEADKLFNQRVEAWLADEATSRVLVKLARENLAAGLTPTL